MSIVNRRNAMIGWVTWTTAKRLATMKAKRAVPKREGGRSTGKKAMTAGAALAAAAGLVVFWRVKHRDATDYDSLAAEELDTRSD
jgi:hypothetical protein